MDIERTELAAVRRYDTWVAWPVSWSAIWVGTLSALAVGLIIGLIGIAVGAHQIGAAKIARWHDVRLIALIFSVCGAFFSFVVGGWVSARIAGIRRAEPAMLHGAIVWTLAIPILLVLGTFGATTHFGGFMSGLAATPGWVATPPAATTDPAVAMAARNAALASLTALLIGLVGSVLGGWLGSGEPMTLAFSSTRERERLARRDIAA